MIKPKTEPGEPGHTRLLLASESEQRLAHYEANARPHAPLERLNTRQVETLAQDPTRRDLIADITQPGTRLTLATIEAELFPPGMFPAQTFTLNTHLWNDHSYAVATLPLNKAIEIGIQEIAQRCRCQIRDCIPVWWEVSQVMSAFSTSRPGRPIPEELSRILNTRLNWYPAKGDHCLSIENRPGPQYAPEMEDALIKATWWECQERFGKRGDNRP